MIVSVFSPVWFVLAVLVAVLVPVLGSRLRKLERAARLKRLMWASIGLCIYWVLYKAVMSFDPDYSFEFINELPFHLCNLGTILAVFAAWKDNRAMQAFLFFCNLLGAFMACLTPEQIFCDVSLFTPRCIGFWGYHCALIVLCLLFVSSGVYKPTLRDIPRALLVLVAVAFMALILNLIMRVTVYPEANYCYSYGMPGNPLTDLLQKYIPIPFVYMLPLAIPVALVDVLLERAAALIRTLKGAAE